MLPYFFLEVLFGLTFLFISLKARPDTKAIFNSIPLFYRALQTISKQHYRVPVRRYIFDLFDVQFNAETINALNAYGKSMRVQPMNMRRDKTERPLTMIRTVQKADEYEVWAYIIIFEECTDCN